MKQVSKDIQKINVNNTWRNILGNIFSIPEMGTILPWECK